MADSTKIEIIDFLPIIMTKDKSWKPLAKVAKPGAIIYLPKDAILLKPIKKGVI